MVIVSEERLRKFNYVRFYSRYTLFKIAHNRFIEGT